MSFSGGNGTKESPYLVSTLEDLDNVRNDLSAHYVQVNDIDASETAEWNDGEGFIPIGSYSIGSPMPFSGSYVGNRYKIIGLTVNNANRGNGTGLFGCVSETATIDEIYIVNSKFVGKWYVGAIAGYWYGNFQKSEWLKIENTEVQFGVRKAGLVGGEVHDRIFNYIHIDRCRLLELAESDADSDVGLVAGSARRTVTKNLFVTKSEIVAPNTDEVGGAVGYLDSKSLIFRAHVNANIRGKDKVGGIFGYHSTTGPIYVGDVIASGRVEGNIGVGGIGGEGGGLHDLVIQRAISRQSQIVGVNYVSGILGRKIGLSGTHPRIFKSYALVEKISRRELDNTNFARICHNASSSTIRDCFAREDMVYSTIEEGDTRTFPQMVIGADARDGANIPIEDTKKIQHFKDNNFMIASRQEKKEDKEIFQLEIDADDIGTLPEEFQEVYGGNNWLIDDCDFTPCLSHQGNNNKKSGLAWLTPGVLENAKVQMQIRMDANKRPSVVFAMSGGDSRENGYYFQLRQDKIVLGALYYGTETEISSVDYEIETGSWYNVVAEKTDESFTFKIWKEWGETEPLAPQINFFIPTDSVGGYSALPPRQGYIGMFDAAAGGKSYFRNIIVETSEPFAVWGINETKTTPYLYHTIAADEHYLCIVGEDGKIRAVRLLDIANIADF